MKTGLDIAVAYQILVDDHGAAPVLAASDIRKTLEANLEGGKVGGVPVAQLGTDDARDKAYDALVSDGKAPERVTEAMMAQTVSEWGFYDVYTERDPSVTQAAEEAQASVKTRVGLSQTADLGLDAISLASIYFLAAIGLAVTFGVMGVINMAHGEFIMMGAYTGYVVQQIVPNYNRLADDCAAAFVCGDLCCGCSHGTVGHPLAL